MTFQDIFKSSFLENVDSVSIVDMALAMILAFGIGLFIFLIYQKTFTGVMYSSSFGVTLVALTMITTLVILAVTSNIVLSLGMVGALSIVRFRTAIKEPLDIVNKKSHITPYIVVLSCTGQESERKALGFLKKQVSRCIVKSKTVQRSMVEVTAEIRMRSEDTEFINALSAMDGVTSAVLVSYNGDYMG